MSIVELGKFDSAIGNIKDRDFFLQLLSSDIFISSSNKGFANRNVFRWISNTKAIDVLLTFQLFPVL
jgi:hypothetical protein